MTELFAWARDALQKGTPQALALALALQAKAKPKTKTKRKLTF